VYGRRQNKQAKETFPALQEGEKRSRGSKEGQKEPPGQEKRNVREKLRKKKVRQEEQRLGPVKKNISLQRGKP